MKDDKILAEAKKRFAQAVDFEANNREAAEEDIKFAAGEQWPEKILKDRAGDHRPTLTLNRIPVYLRKVVNDVRQNRPSIKVVGVDQQADEDTAEVLTGLIRNIEVQSDAPSAYDAAIDSSARGGFGVIAVTTDYADDGTFEQDIKIKRVRNPFAWYWDPNATEPNKSDARWAFETELIDKDEAASLYGDDVADWEGDGKGDTDDLWREGDKVRIAAYWRVSEDDQEIVQLTNGAVITREEFTAQAEEIAAAGLEIATDAEGRELSRKAKKRRVTQYMLSGGKVLKTTPWPGRYIPAAFVPGDETIVDGKPVLKGLVRDLKDAQRMLNYWRSAATEKVALEPKAPWLVPEGSIDGYEQEWDEANTRNLPYLLFKPNAGGAPTRQMFSGNAAPMLEQSIAAAQDLKDISGIHDASLGAQGNETSGVAIMQRQRQGDNSTFHFGDNLRRAVAHVGRIIVDLLPHIYDAQRAVRVLNPDETSEMTVINTLFPPPGQKRAYDVRVGKYDVVVEAGPSYATQRQEAVSSMVEMTRAQPNLMAVIGDLMVSNMDWPGADEMAKRLKAMLPPQVAAIADQETPIPPQAQAQMAQMQQQMQQMGQQLQQSQQALAQAQGALNSKQLELQGKQLDLQSAQADAASSQQSAALNAQVEQLQAEVKRQEAGVRMAEVELEREKLAMERERMAVEAMQQQMVVGDHMTQMGAIQQAIEAIGQQVQALAARAHGPRQIIKGEGGVVLGVRLADGTEMRVVRDESGNSVGIEPANMH